MSGRGERVDGRMERRGARSATCSRPPATTCPLFSPSLPLSLSLSLPLSLSLSLSLSHPVTRLSYPPALALIPYVHVQPSGGGTAYRAFPSSLEADTLANRFKVFSAPSFGWRGASVRCGVDTLTRRHPKAPPVRPDKVVSGDEWAAFFKRGIRVGSVVGRRLAGLGSGVIKGRVVYIEPASWYDGPMVVFKEMGRGVALRRLYRFRPTLLQVLPRIR